MKRIWGFNTNSDCSAFPLAFELGVVIRASVLILSLCGPWATMVMCKETRGWFEDTCQASQVNKHF
jgi:hypothetical protein